MKKIFTILLVVLGVGVWNSELYAATISWDGGGDGSTWSDPLNWDNNTLPQSGDDINIFMNSDITVDIDVNCNNLQVISFSTPNLILSSSITLSITGTTISFSGATLLANASSTVVFAGSNQQTIPIQDYYNVTINNSGGTIINSALTIMGNLTFTSGTLLFNPYSLEVQGDISGTGLIGGSQAILRLSDGTATPATMTLPSISSGLDQLFVDRNGSSVTLGSNLLVRDSLLIGTGTTLNGGAVTLSLVNAFTNNGTFNPQTGTISFDGNINLESTSTGSFSFNNVEFKTNFSSISGKDFTVSGNWVNLSTSNIASNVTFDGTTNLNTSSQNFLSNVDFSASSNVTMASNLNIAGDLTFANGATFAPGSFTVTLSGDAAQQLSTNGVSLNNLTLSSTVAKDVTLADNLDLGGNLLIGANADLVAGSFNINVAGNWTITSGGGFDAGTGTVVFDGANQDISPGSGNPFADLEIAGSGITTLLGNVDVDGNCAITSGTMSLDIYTLFLEGNLVNDGTFDGGTGTVNFDGANSSITGTNPVTFHNLTISSGETLTAPNQMFVQGNWTNNGSFDAGTGTVTFSGGNNQTTSGSTTFHNLTIDKTGGEALTLSTSSHGIDNILKLQNGQLNTGGNLTLFSNSSGTAKLAKVETGASISGNIIAQRYVGGSKTEGRYQFGPPVDDQTRTAWQDDLPTQFLPNSVLAYDEPSDSWVNPGSSTISPGTGVTVWVNTEDISGGEFNVDFTGPPVTGNVTIPLTVSGSFEGGGWNLVANPYLCTVDWDAASGWGKGAINNSIYFWNEVDEAYNVYVGTDGSNLTGVGTGSASRYIPSGQAFFVKASSAGNLTVTEDAKITTENPTFLRENAPDSLLRITLFNSTEKKDEAIIRFIAGTTDSLDGNADAVKWYGNILNVSSLTPKGDKLVVNTMPGFDTEKVIPLEVKAKKTGKFKMAFTGISSFTGTKIHLRDKFLNQTVEISDQLLYEFSITNEAASHGTERFEIVFSTPLMLTFDDQEERVGDLLNVPLLVENFANLVSGQLSVVWNPDHLIYEGIKDFSLSSMGEGNFGTTDVDKGILTFSWDQPDLKGQTLANGDSLFTIEFKLKSAPGDSSYIFVSDDPVMIEFADADLNNVQTEIDTGWIKSLRKIWLTGTVNDAADKAVANVKMILEGKDLLDTLTDSNGIYNFEIFEGDTYSLFGELENNPNDIKNGISTIDIALIRRHILNKKLFDQPFAYLAADVDNNKLISTLDIAHLRSLILGKSANLPGDRIWKVVPNSSEPPDPLNIMESILIDDFSKDTSYFDFAAIKLGDVDYSSNSNVRMMEESFVEIGVPAIHAARDSIISVPLNVKDFYNISAFQFTIHWDPTKLKFLQLDDNHLNIQTGQQNIQDGYLPVIWDDFGGSSINLEDENALVALKFKVMGDAGESTTININSDITEALVAGSNLQKLNLTVNPGRVDIFNGGDEFQLIQNYPNPFHQETRIPFIIPEDGAVELTIYDAQGRIIHRTNNNYKAGYNEIKVLDNQLMQSGLFHYKLNFGGIIRTKQMLMN